MWLNIDHNFGVNFKCPKGLTANVEALFPLTDALDVAYAAAVVLDIKQQKTIVNVAPLTGNVAISLNIDPQVQKGAEIIVMLVSSAATLRTVTWGAGISDETARVTNKTRSAHFYYDGTVFRCFALNENNLPLEGLPDVQTLAYAANIAMNITNQFTIVNIAQLTGTLALTATIDAGLIAGAHLLVKLQSDGTARTTTPGAGLTGKAIAGANNKTNYASFLYDGTSFIHIGTNQID